MRNNTTIENDNSLDNPISYGSKINRNTLGRIQFSEIVHTIKTGSDGIQEKIKKIRASQTDEERRELKKNNLPYFNMGLFKGDVRNDSLLEQTQHIIFDCDHIADRIIELKDLLKNDPDVFAVFLSQGGDGLKIIYKLEAPITDAAIYASIYKHYADKFNTKYGYELDSTGDASRACFLSYDPDLYVNVDSVPLTTNVRPVISTAGTVGPKKKSAKASTDPLANLLSVGVSAGDRTATASKIIGHCIQRGFSEAVALEMLLMWNQKNIPPHNEAKITYMVNDEFKRYNLKKPAMPFEMFERDGCYYKVSYKKQVRTDILLTSFLIEPKELLQLPDGDCLKCDIVASNGETYKDKLIENTDWTSKSKMLTALGNQNSTFHGTDNDVQGLCRYVNDKVTVRKKGTKVIGLHDNLWVTEDSNITVSGLLTDAVIVPYDKGADAFYHGISYPDIPEVEYQALVSGFYSNVMQVNEATTIGPMLGWVFSSVTKPILMDHAGSFPLAFVHGGQGSGKTTTGKMFLRLLGYKDCEPKSCTMRSFPILKLLASTNAIPILLDEFKVSDMREDEVDSLLRYMRKTYAGEVESKGRADQTVQDYSLTAPMAVMGEWGISQPAIKERILLVRFGDAVKKSEGMQQAFKAIWDLSLESFMPRYIQFCLGQDIVRMYETARQLVIAEFNGITVAPRIINNLSVMVLGIELFRAFGKAMSIPVPSIDISAILRNQLKEITGTDSGFVRSAVDQLIEELSIMAQQDKIKEEDYRVLRVEDKNKKSVEVLALKFNKIFPDFKVYARMTGYEGDLLDRESYMGLFDECGYIALKNTPVKFGDKTVRALCIDIKRAQHAGVCLEGFGI